jgi:type IV pilus assembly protein PilY1
VATQPITTQPVVVTNPDVGSTAQNSPNVLVMVGSGQFLAATDKSSITTQAFYGVWDNGVTNNITQSQLVQQTFTTSSNKRILTNTPVPYTSGNSSQLRYGWYIQFTGGERILSPGSIVSARISTNNIFETEIFFSTFIPNTALHCAYGGGGWLMAAKADNGGQPSASLIDVNNDNQINSSDLSGGQVVSGIQFTTGVPAQPVIRGDYLFIPTSSGTLVKIRITGTGLTLGRISWQLLFQN